MSTFCKARWARQKRWKENHETKVIKIPKPKRRKYGMNETIELIFELYENWIFFSFLGSFGFDGPNFSFPDLDMEGKIIYFSFFE